MNVQCGSLRSNFLSHQVQQIELSSLLCEPAPCQAKQAVQQFERPNLEPSAGYPVHARTTIMLRNLPDGFTRENLLKLLDSHGFAGCYDFAYLPVNFETLIPLTHAFVNMLSPAHAERVHECFEGFSDWAIS